MDEEKPLLLLLMDPFLATITAAIAGIVLMTITDWILRANANN